MKCYLPARPQPDHSGDRVAMSVARIAPDNLDFSLSSLESHDTVSDGRHIGHDVTRVLGDIPPAVRRNFILQHPGLARSEVAILIGLLLEDLHRLGISVLVLDDPLFPNLDELTELITQPDTRFHDSVQHHRSRPLIIIALEHPEVGLYCFHPRRGVSFLIRV